jgi:hypothetical protein
LSDAANLANNIAWLNAKIANGYSAIDIGLVPRLVSKGNLESGIFYGAETGIVNSTQWAGTGTIWKAN